MCKLVRWRKRWAKRKIQRGEWVSEWDEVHSTNVNHSEIESISIDRKMRTMEFFSHPKTTSYRKLSIPSLCNSFMSFSLHLNLCSICTHIGGQLNIFIYHEIFHSDKFTSSSFQWIHQKKSTTGKSIFGANERSDNEEDSSALDA